MWPCVLAFPCFKIVLQFEVLWHFWLPNSKFAIRVGVTLMAKTGNRQQKWHQTLFWSRFPNAMHALGRMALERKEDTQTCQLDLCVWLPFVPKQCTHVHAFTLQICCNLTLCAISAVDFQFHHKSGTKRDQISHRQLTSSMSRHAFGCTGIRMHVVSSSWWAADGISDLVWSHSYGKIGNRQQK